MTVYFTILIKGGGCLCFTQNDQFPLSSCILSETNTSSEHLLLPMHLVRRVYPCTKTPWSRLPYQ